jgi:16S rRNA (cytosine1402-N4)-methyltransferase
MHRSVLLDEVLEYLRPSGGQTIVDCTVGCAGHAKAIAERIAPDGKLIGIDRDDESLDIARGNLEEFKSITHLARGNFKDIKSILSGLDIGKADGFLFDLGISSFQLEKEERGFSIKSKGPLDMRMDRGLSVGAGEIVNSCDENELARIIREYGEERYSGRIARAIVSKRPLTDTKNLADTVSAAVPGGYRYGRIHPATRTFQAIRIAVNGELDAIKPALDGAISMLDPGGKIAVISFHSLEDRIVKHRFRDLSKEGALNILTKKPVRPGRAEVVSNPRARSAKLRVAERA